MLSVSCESQYRVIGIADDAFLDGSRVYLKRQIADDWRVLDSCDILHGKFEMSGVIDTTTLTAFFVDDEAVIPLILESGNIDVFIDRRSITVSGTNMNNQLTEFIARKEGYENRLSELERMETSMILDGYKADEAAAHVRDSIKTVVDAMDDYVEAFIKEHYNTLLGPCVFRLLCSTLPYPYVTRQIERIMVDATDTFKNNPLVKEFLVAAEKNGSTLRIE